jgi:hypothetical protein
VTAVPCGDAWDLAPRATRLTDTAWNWAALEDGTYEIEDFMRVMNESRSPVNVGSIEVFYNGTQPDIEFVSEPPPGYIEPYDYVEYAYIWNAHIADSEYDAVIRFNTDGGTCDFTLANRNDLDLETADSAVLWTFDSVGETSVVPTSIELSQNYPNPFNPSTTIEFALVTPGQVTLDVYNVLGEQIATLADGYRSAGTHVFNFVADDLSSGVYLYRLVAGDQVITRKMILVK